MTLYVTVCRPNGISKAEIKWNVIIAVRADVESTISKRTLCLEKIILFLLEMSYYLTRVVSLFPSCAETGGGQDEDLLGHGVDFPHTFVVVHHRDLGFSNPQGNGSG